MKKFIRTYQIPPRITMGIFRLPCVYCIRKFDGEPVWELTDYYDENSNYHQIYNIDGEEPYHAVAGDWLCYDGEDWYKLTNEEYERVNK